MPPLRKTEITGGQLDYLVAYIARNYTKYFAFEEGRGADILSAHVPTKGDRMPLGAGSFFRREVHDQRIQILITDFSLAGTWHHIDAGTYQLSD
jgi:hypothetical protein